MRRPELKVIYLTVYDIPGVEDEAIGPVLHKPIDDEQLVAEVRGALWRPAYFCCFFVVRPIEIR
jgi:hypothetical protein